MSSVNVNSNVNINLGKLTDVFREYANESTNVGELASRVKEVGSDFTAEVSEGLQLFAEEGVNEPARYGTTAQRNNEIRRAFYNVVVQQFGGDASKIPARVQEAMRLKDFGGLKKGDLKGGLVLGDLTQDAFNSGKKLSVDRVKTVFAAIEAEQIEKKKIGIAAYDELKDLLDGRGENSRDKLFAVKQCLDKFVCSMTGGLSGDFMNVAESLAGSKPGSPARTRALELLCEQLEECKEGVKNGKEQADSYASALLGFKARLQNVEYGRDLSATPAVRLPKRGLEYINAQNKLRAINLMACSVRGKGAGHIGLIGDRVIKFNTHIGERLSSKSGKKEQMVASCNALRRQMYELLDVLLDDKSLCAKLKKQLGACDSKEPLDRAVVASVIKKLVDGLAYKEDGITVMSLNLRPDAYTLKAYASDGKDTSFASFLEEEQKVHPEVVEELKREAAQLGFKGQLQKEDGASADVESQPESVKTEAQVPQQPKPADVESQPKRKFVFEGFDKQTMDKIRAEQHERLKNQSILKEAFILKINNCDMMARLLGELSYNLDFLLRNDETASEKANADLKQNEITAFTFDKKGRAVLDPTASDAKLLKDFEKLVDLCRDRMSPYSSYDERVELREDVVWEDLFDYNTILNDKFRNGVE